MNWRRASYHITLAHAPLGQEHVKVDGIILGTGHIGMHLRGEWVDVTHIPSGCRLAAFPSVGSALNFAELVQSLHDWSQVHIPQDLAPKVRNAATYALTTLTEATPARGAQMSL